MPRKSPTDPQDPNLQDAQVRLREHRNRKRADDDPRLPVPQGAMKNVTPDAPQIGGAASKDQFSKFARNIIAEKGDIVRAICVTIDKDPNSEADLRYVTDHLEELHANIRAASRSATSVAELLEKHDLTLEVRLALLREMAFSDKEPVRLKAIEMIADLDETSKSKRLGSTMEDIFRIARAKAAAKLAKSKG